MMPRPWSNKAVPSSSATPASSASDLPLKAKFMTSELPKTAVAETLAGKIAALKPGVLPAETARKCEDLLIDIVGLPTTALNEDYVKAALAGSDDDGPCTVIGHGRTLTASGAAFVNGTAAHGEDFDDTFEGGPVHAGAVIVPAVLAACERHRPDGATALLGIAIGTETMCRLSTVVPKAVHKAGFHPTAIFGVMGAAAGVGAALGLNAKQLSTRSASPAASPPASSNISPRAPGPSGCIPAGRRNRACARRCWRAPASLGPARCSRACTDCFKASRTRPKATMRRWTISAPAG